MGEEEIKGPTRCEAIRNVHRYCHVYGIDKLHVNQLHLNLLTLTNRRERERERMENQETLEPLDLDTILSQARNFLDIHRNSNDSSEESNKLLQDCVVNLESGFKQIEDEFSDFDSLGLEDLEAYVEHLKKELNLVESEKAEISKEVNGLTEIFLEDTIRLENGLEGLDTALKFFNSQGVNKLQTGVKIGCSIPSESGGRPMNACCDYNFEILELDHLIEKKKVTLRSMHDLHYIFQRDEAIGQIEDMLSEVKVIEFDENCIRLSIRTPLMTLAGLLCRKKFDFVIEPSVVDHELLIELVDGTMELKNVEIVPNDFHIGEVVDAAKSFRLRQPFPSSSLIELRSCLEWLVRKVQYRIILCNLRRLIVKDANKSSNRHSFEYYDRDETIIAHLVEGVDAHIQIPQNWPASTSALKLISLKSSYIHSMGITSSILCKVEELANSLSSEIRLQLLSFMDAVEGILNQQKHLELPSDQSGVGIEIWFQFCLIPKFGWEKNMESRGRNLCPDGMRGGKCRNLLPAPKRGESE
ncbi:reverse transcriptase-like protein [Tasmannia lanceolata]|uniref:reverse transcriptase-like protein n=1 Tax=Tasmannia lanceolata TaxID=3420 RepID=UPI004063E4C8